MIAPGDAATTTTRPSGTFDLVVVGAGIIGAFAAYFAVTLRPSWRTLVVERSFAASGATRYSAGLDLPYADTPLRADLVAESLPVYETLLRADLRMPITEHPLSCVVERDRYDDELARFVGPAPGLASNSEVAALKRAHADLRFGASQILLGGLRCRIGDAAGAALALLTRVANDGVRVWEGVEVTGAREQDGAVVLPLADGRAIWSSRVILAPGPWALTGPAARVALAAGIRVKKVVALHLDRPAVAGDPVVWFAEDDAFLMPLPPRRWLFSFASREWDCAPESSLLNISAGDRELALSILSCYCPEAPDYCSGGRVFCDAYGPGRDPIVTADADVPGVVFAGAGSGSGFRLAPAIASRALAMVEPNMET